MQKCVLVPNYIFEASFFIYFLSLFWLCVVIKIYHCSQSKSAPVRGKKGHNGEMNYKDVDASEQPAIEKHVDDLSDQVDVHPPEQV